jgi:hypothetical protein
MRVSKTAMYWARSSDAMRNGSFVRINSKEKSDMGSLYINGDFMGAVKAEIAYCNPDLVPFTREQAKELLPLCCRP